MFESVVTNVILKTKLAYDILIISQYILSVTNADHAEGEVQHSSIFLCLWDD